MTIVESGDVGLDRFDASVAAGASGSLRAFNRAGILDSADVHIAHRLAQLAGVEGEAGEAVALGVAFATRAPRLGHVCVDLRTIRQTASRDIDLATDLDALPWPDPEAWLDALSQSPLVGAGQPALAVGVEPLPEPPLARRTTGGDRTPGPGRTRRGRRRPGAPARRPGDDVPRGRPEDGGSRPPATDGRCSRRSPARLGHRRRTRDGKDHDRGPAVGVAPSAGARPGRRPAAHRLGGADGQGGAAAGRSGARRGTPAGLGRRHGGAAPGAARDDAASAPRARRRQPDPVPAQRNEPTPPRRGRRGRDLHGRPVHDGPAPRGTSS